MAKLLVRRIIKGRSDVDLRKSRLAGLECRICSGQDVLAFLLELAERIRLIPNVCRISVGHISGGDCIARILLITVPLFVHMLIRKVALGYQRYLFWERDEKGNVSGQSSPGKSKRKTESYATSRLSKDG